MPNLIRPLLLVVACATAPLAFALGDPPATVLDPIEVNAAYKHELLTQMVQLGLDRGRSSHKEDLDRIACVRDKRPGTQFVSIRCASNRDWDRLAHLSISRAYIGTTDSRVDAYAGCGYLFNALNLTKQTRNQTDPQYGVITVDPRLLLARDDDLTEAQRIARITELLGLIAANSTSDATGASPEEVVRFARTMRQVETADDAAATVAIADAGYSIERYNALVAHYERDERFRSRVAVAMAMSDPALVF